LYKASLVLVYKGRHLPPSIPQAFFFVNKLLEQYHSKQNLKLTQNFLPYQQPTPYHPSVTHPYTTPPKMPSSDSKPNTSFDAASISTDSIMSEKERARAQNDKKPSLAKRVVQGT
jgi:hypothetical protein